LEPTSVPYKGFTIVWIGVTYPGADGGAKTEKKIFLKGLDQDQDAQKGKYKSDMVTFGSRGLDEANVEQ
jgi:hypothetical protein